MNCINKTYFILGCDCNNIHVTLEDQVQTYQGASHTFYKGENVNGKESWVSSTRAIWYDPVIKDWKIGTLGNLGTSTGYIVTAVDQDQSSIACPYGYPSDAWKYYQSGAWHFTSVGEIIVECYDGHVPGKF